MFSNFFEKIHILQNLYIKNKCFLKKKSYSMDGEDIEIAKRIINDCSKSLGIKKGILMKSLRVALLGSLHGPDLLTSWSLLAKINEDKKRIERCLKN